MRRFFLLLVCLLFTPGVWAQALKNLTKVGRSAAVNVSKIEVTALERSVKKAMEPLITTPYGTMSVTAYFHRMGNMEFWTPPKPVPLPEVRPFKPAYGSEKRSREWLTQQLTAREFLPEVLETMSYAQLEDLYTTYEVSSNITACKPTGMEESLTRNDNVYMNYVKNPRSSRDKLSQWAFGQPDYHLGNYLPLDYQQPFHPNVKSLRILLISDDYGIVRRIRTAEDKMENIHIDAVGHIDIGIKHLENPETKYDIIVTDFFVPGGKYGRGAYDVGMYVWNKKLNIPVILLSKAEEGDSQAMIHNIVGQFPYLETIDDAHRLFNYLSNMVATGKAFPSEMPPLLHLQTKLKELDMAIEQDPVNWDLYAQRSNVRRILGDKKGALEDSKKSNELFHSTH